MKTKAPSRWSRRGLIRELDDEIRRIVRERDKTCLTPGGCFGPLEVSHFFARRFQHTRWDLRNVHLQCQKHNQDHGLNRIQYETLMMLSYEPDTLAELACLAMRQDKLTDDHLETLLAELRAK
jgi:hypothetical protein